MLSGTSNRNGNAIRASALPSGVSKILKSIAPMLPLPTPFVPERCDGVPARFADLSEPTPTTMIIQSRLLSCGCAPNTIQRGTRC